MRLLQTFLLASGPLSRRLSRPAGLFAHPFSAYAVSGLFHVMALSGLSVWAARQSEISFSMQQGDGGQGQQRSFFGSIGGAKTTPVFEIHLPTASVAATGEVKEEAVAEVVLPAASLEPESLEPIRIESPVPVAVALNEPQSEEEPLPVLEAEEVPDQTLVVEAAAAAVDRSESEEQIPTTSEPLERPRITRRELAAAPQVSDAPIALPDMAANGRGEEGTGSGNLSGPGNGGASGLAGGNLESIARTGPWNPSPVYPEAARVANMEGVVRVWLKIRADGTVMRAVLWRSSGWPILDEAAMNVIPHWRFEPARRGGISVPCDVILPVDFYLPRS